MNWAGPTSQTRVLLALFVLLSGRNVTALDIYMAPIAYLDDSGAEPIDSRRPGQDLLDKFAGIEIGDSVSVRSVEDAEQSPPQSFLEAARLCESQGYPYLLYGYIKRTPFSYYAEVKLLARENKDVAAAFIAGDDASHYQRLIDDLAAKIVTYINDDLGMAPPRSGDQPARNILRFPVSIGYWTPTGGSWSSSMAGLVCADLSIRFVPTMPLFHFLKKPAFLAMGIDTEYGLAVNRPGLESFFLHAVKLRLPVEAFLELGGGHRIGLGLGPLLEIDTMLQSRLYGSTVTETAITPGASFSILYHYVLSASVSLGISNILDVAFYAQPLITYSPRVFVDLRLGGSSEEQQK